MPSDIKEKALRYLDGELRAIYEEWAAFAPPDVEEFKMLTKYIGKIAVANSFGEWVIDRKNDGATEQPIEMPWVRYSGLVNAFVEEFYPFVESHPEYEHAHYNETLGKHKIPWGWVAGKCTKRMFRAMTPRALSP